MEERREGRGELVSIGMGGRLTVKVIIGEYVGSDEEIILAHRVFLSLGTLCVCWRGMCRQYMGPRLPSVGTEEP